MGEEDLVRFLVDMASKASTKNPGRLTPAGAFFEVELGESEEEEFKKVADWNAEPRLEVREAADVMKALEGEMRDNEERSREPRPQGEGIKQELGGSGNIGAEELGEGL